MESAPLPLKINYVTYSHVIKIEERMLRYWVSGIGANAVFKDQPAGWFLHMVGSNEAIYLGTEKPTLTKGDKIKITIERVTDV